MPDGGRLAIATANVNVGARMLDCSGAEVIPGRYAVISVTDTGSGMDRRRWRRFSSRSSRPSPTIAAPASGSRWSTASCGRAAATSPWRAVPAWGRRSASTCRGSSSRSSADAARVRAGAAPSARIGDDPAGRRRGGRCACWRVAALERYRLHGHCGRQRRRGVPALRRSHAPIDLLITDVVMPRMNGTDLAVALRRENANLKVVFVSGYTSGALNEVMAADNTSFLQKPFTPVALAQAVRQLLDSPSAARLSEPVVAAPRRPAPKA